MTGVRAPADVVDVGAGTGHLARVLAHAGHRVVAVEPNDEMRAAAADPADAALDAADAAASVDAAADAALAVSWVAGSAEQMPLPPASFDLWTAGQAFHWFDPERAGIEARRVLRPAGTSAVALVWNHLDVDDASARALRRLLFSHERSDAARGAMSRERLARFLGHDAFELRTLTQEQRLDRDGFVARVFSSDLVPARGEAGAERLTHDAHELFAAHERDGVLSLRYVVEVVCAKLAR